MRPVLEFRRCRLNAPRSCSRRHQLSQQRARVRRSPGAGDCLRAWNRYGSPQPSVTGTPQKASGLGVCDIPAEQAAHLGGLRQERVRGRIGGADFASSVMPAGGGRLAPSVSKTMMSAAGVRVGDETEIEIHAVGSD